MRHITRTIATMKSERTDGLEQRILAALDGLQFGAVEITVHEGRVIQIERREKFRFPSQLAGKN